MNTRAASLLATAALCGCAAGTDGTLTRRYTGFVEVTERREAGATRVERVRGIGLRVGNGVVLGGFDERWLSLPPDCRLVVIVKTEEQLQQWARLAGAAAQTGESSTCVRLLDF